MRSRRRIEVARAAVSAGCAVAISFTCSPVLRADDGASVVAIDTDASVIQAGNGTDPGGTGGSATGYSDPTAASPPTVYVAGGAGQNEGSGGSATAIGTGSLNAGGGGWQGDDPGVSGGAGGGASAYSVTTGYMFSIGPNQYTMNFPYGTNVGVAVQGGNGGGGIGANGNGASGGDGGDILGAVGIAVGTETSNGASVGVGASGGGGGSGQGGSGGNGGSIAAGAPVSASASSDWGGAVSATLQVSGGTGGSAIFAGNIENGMPDSGGSVDLENQVYAFSSTTSESSPGNAAGAIKLEQDATGGTGGDAQSGDGGSEGNATSKINIVISPSNVDYTGQSLSATTYATGQGHGGSSSGSGYGGAGGNTIASTVLLDANTNPVEALGATAIANTMAAGSSFGFGGTAGGTASATASADGYSTSTVAMATGGGGGDGVNMAGGGTGGDGGDATATATSTTTAETQTIAKSSAVGGYGGAVEEQPGFISEGNFIGGKGGNATATATAAGYSASAVATASGGTGGGTLSNTSGDTFGAVGGDATATADGGLGGAQATATGGDGGSGYFGGNGGNATANTTTNGGTAQANATGGTGIGDDVLGNGGNATATADAENSEEYALAIAQGGNANSTSMNPPTWGMGGSATATAIFNQLSIGYTSPGTLGVGGYAYVYNGINGVGIGGPPSGPINNPGGGAVSVTGPNKGILPGITGCGALIVGDGVSATTVQLAANSGGSSVGSLIIGAGSTLDISNNHIFICYGMGDQPDPIALIVAWIQSGYDGGAWDGTGISSSAAEVTSLSYGIGYADSADPGNPAGLPSGEIEIAYTLLGDANLDGKVNGTDFNILAANFNTGGDSWDQGDFNYDNKVNGSDFNFLASNFNQGASLADLAALDSFAAANEVATNVPEPVLGLAVPLAAVGMMRRRQRRY